MFKIVGAAAVMLAAGLIGIKKYTEFSERRKILCSMRDGAEKIRTNLRCMCMPLYECFLSAGDFFGEVAAEMKEGKMPSEAVHSCLLKISFLTEDEKETVERFADGLAAEDTAGQVANVDVFILRLDKNIEKATAETETKGKLILKGSFLSAAAIILILI